MIKLSNAISRRHRHRIFMYAACIAGAFTGCADLIASGCNNSGSQMITLTISDSLSGVLPSNVVVTVTDPAGQVTRYSGDLIVGSNAYIGTASGAYVLDVRAPGYKSWDANVVVPKTACANAAPVTVSARLQRL
jgi:hypothetical protein